MLGLRVRGRARGEARGPIRARWAKIVVAWSITLVYGNLLKISAQGADSTNIRVIWTPAKTTTR